MVNVEKLVPNLRDKEKYVLHYKNLQLYLSLGMKIKKVHRVLEFDQSPWMEPYIRLNTELRKKTNSSFAKEFFKLMNNSSFGKTMENIRNRVDVKIMRSTDKEKFRKIIAKPNFNRAVIFSEELAALHVNKTQLTLNKPIYVGMSILDLSKHLMFDWYYNVLKERYNENCTMCYTDTDSYILEIKDNDIYKTMGEMADHFDTSDFPRDHPLYSELNKKVLGKFKDELNSIPIAEYIGLRPKMYTILTEKKEIKKAKGVTKSVLEKKINFDNYKDTLTNSNVQNHKMNMIRSQKHQIYGISVNKTTLSPLDTKRYIAADKITTYAFGYQPEQ